MTTHQALPPASWRALRETVQGASHVRKGAPNQDYCDICELTGGAGVILAVADGHGDKMHARSERGSYLAVQSALAVLKEWADGADDHAVNALRRDGTGCRILRAAR